MKKNNNKYLKLRSEKVRYLLDENPPWYVTWGTVFVIFIFLILSLILCLVPYPHSAGESILQHWIYNAF